MYLLFIDTTHFIQGWPVLARACDNCYRSIVELLLRKGSNVNKATRYVGVKLINLLNDVMSE